MTETELQSLNTYLSIMTFACRILNQGLMTPEEYARIEQTSADDCNIPDGSLYREKWLEIA